MSWHDQLYFSSGSTVNNWLARQARFLLFSKTNRTNQRFKKVLSSCKSFLPSQKQNGPMADDFWCQTKWLISCERKVSSSDYTMLSCLSIKKYYISWQQSETVILMQLNTYKSIPCGELSLHTTGKFQWEIAIFIISPGINQSGLALALHCRCPSDHFHRLFPPKTFAWPAPPQPGGPHPLSHWQLVPASRPCRGLPAVGTCRHQPNQSICCAIHNNKKRCLRWLKFNICLSRFVDPKQNCNKIEAQAIY